MEARLTNDSPITTKYEDLFTFSNGDKYEGGYRINEDEGYLLLVRQGKGTYRTDNFDRYEVTWECDKIASVNSNLHDIRFNNGMTYKGNLDENNASTSGAGIYNLPDGSSVEAIWKDNRPVSNILYKEPLGYIWKHARLSEDRHSVRLMAGNHFWDGIVSALPRNPEKNATIEPIENN